MNSNQRTIVGFDKILEELKRLSGEKRSGTLFITTDDNHAARFVLEGGEVTSLGYRHYHGYDALPRIQKIRSGYYRFVDQGFMSMEEVPMPETSELLGLLQMDRGDEDNLGPAAADPSDETLATLRRELTVHIGPIAAILCEEYLQDHGKPADPAALARMIHHLAAEIGEPRKRDLFISRVK
ncbi:DUF4388 domain-containing protein [Sedimenticola hydrogenitrophicus]|uniref:DUF4388 domain-containing protein n=1 Tax=Sedimenticola hydrogenitrophicus TaxID=2967975 RepID=UPI0021A7885A|nr:DUF4388 domain-containing protein [Sedimenticola hydrogenitrophicus]